ncbi:Nucleolar protein 9 [Ceratocystis platani]|uniref:Nucleolar protein 9 n=1 Tax=Ceratocystis fimbriata f. sp. platani TaxID=88771 RepID=A0A0F8B7G0_CERFI|nr:Nucleolar protein 9 [Ceratocystis platani]
MGKTRTKRSTEEKKRKCDDDDHSSTKRSRIADNEPQDQAAVDTTNNNADFPAETETPDIHDESVAWEIDVNPKATESLQQFPSAEETYGDEDGNQGYGNGAPEREFFGMLTDEEQEYFRSADEVLELNQFPTPEDRRIFLANVYKEARGKELKLASSQSCSRLMERLILLSTRKQKKHLFEQFAGHFLSLVQHRFASHCCETLFLQSAPVVSLELGGVSEELLDGDVEDDFMDVDENGKKKTHSSMEDMFLLTLDELDGQLNVLLTDRYGSHTLRVLLIVLSGRPLEDAKTKSLLKSKNAEHISVPGAIANSSELTKQARPVPANFTFAVKKIIGDLTATMDPAGIRILARHPTGNPLLQLLVEIDLSLQPKGKKKTGTEEPADSLLSRILPDAPESLSNPESPASDFFNSMIYDPLGSRLIETIITHAPSKTFKALQTNMFDARIHAYARNDVASYPAIRALERMSGKDLSEAIDKITPTIGSLIERQRFNVVKALLERASARNIRDRIDGLRNAIVSACGHDPKNIVPVLCALRKDAKDAKDAQKVAQKNTLERAAAHGAQLVAAMLTVAGPPTKAVQTSLLSLRGDELLALGTTSPSSASILVTALEQPSLNQFFHKALIAGLVPHSVALATNNHGHRVVEAIISVPTRGDGRSVPFHIKEQVMAQMGARETEMRESWAGRAVWRAWKGDFWKRKRLDWVRWVKEADGSAPEAQFAASATLNKGQRKYIPKEEWEREKASKHKHQQRPPRRVRETNVEQQQGEIPM